MDMNHLSTLFVSLIEKNNLINLNNAGSYSNALSFWGQLCRAYHGHFDKVKSLNIQAKYRNNYGNLKDLVNNLLMCSPLNGVMSGSEIQQEKEVNQSENVITLFLTSAEWKKIYQINVNGSAIRKKFRAGFAHFLSKKIQSNGLNCYLNDRKSSNWFKEMKWRGLYKCSACDLSYLCIISDINDDKNIKITIKWTGSSNHAKVSRREQCRGETRKHYAVKLVADGVVNFRSQMINENHLHGELLIFK